MRRISNVSALQLKLALQEHAVNMVAELREFLPADNLHQLESWCNDAIGWDSDFGDTIALVASNYLRSHIVVFKYASGFLSCFNIQHMYRTTSDAFGRYFDAISPFDGGVRLLTLTLHQNHYSSAIPTQHDALQRELCALGHSNLEHNPQVLVDAITV
jgi:hypothetical protein